jgi:hypothetical protein
MMGQPAGGGTGASTLTYLNDVPIFSCEEADIKQIDTGTAGVGGNYLLMLFLTAQVTYSGSWTIDGAPAFYLASTPRPTGFSGHVYVLAKPHTGGIVNLSGVRIFDGNAYILLYGLDQNVPTVNDIVFTSANALVTPTTISLSALAGQAVLGGQVYANTTGSLDPKLTEDASADVRTAEWAYGGSANNVAAGVFEASNNLAKLLISFG